MLGIPYFRVHALAVNDAGEISGETHTVVLPRADLAEFAPDAAFRHFRYTTEWSVEPGTYDIRLLIAEDGGDRFGTSRLELRVPSSDGWTMADPMLGVGDADAGFTPLLDESVSAGIQISASIQIRGATSPYVSAAIFHPATLSTIADIPVHGLRPVGLSVHSGVLPLPYLDPGEYTVELYVADTAADGRAVRLMPLRVVEGH